MGVRSYPTDIPIDQVAKDFKKWMHQLVTGAAQSARVFQQKGIIYNGFYENLECQDLSSIISVLTTFVEWAHSCYQANIWGGTLISVTGIVGNHTTHHFHSFALGPFGGLPNNSA